VKVSVLIATRNREAPLLRCLRTLTEQEVPDDFEIIVVDDASDQLDVRSRVADEFGDRVVCYRTGSPRGVAGARNLLIAKATGDVLVFLDDDAFPMDRSAIFNVKRYFDEHPRCGVLAFKIHDIQPGLDTLLVPFSKHALRGNPRLAEEEGKVSYFIGAGHALRRDVVVRAGIYQDNFVYGLEELDLSYRAIQAEFEIHYCPGIRIEHRPAPSVLVQNSKRLDAELLYRVKNRFYLVKRYLPLPYPLTYLPVWLTKHAIDAVSRGALRAYFRGILEGVRGLAAVPRTPLSPEAVAYLKENHGRLWY